MALVKKAALPGPQALARDGEQAAIKQLGRFNEENRRKARTYAKQQKAAERLYKNAGAPGDGGAAPGGGATSGNGHADDVIDAEVVEEKK